jgi:hypothetical protein
MSRKTAGDSHGLTNPEKNSNGKLQKIIRFYWPTLIRWQTISVTGVMALNVLLSAVIPLLTSVGGARLARATSSPSSGY